MKHIKYKYLSTGSKELGLGLAILIGIVMIMLLPLLLLMWQFVFAHVLLLTYFLKERFIYYIKYDDEYFYIENVFLKTEQFDKNLLKEVVQIHPFTWQYGISFKNGKSYHFLSSSRTVAAFLKSLSPKEEK
jgi:hypothetical protein